MLAHLKSIAPYLQLKYHNVTRAQNNHGNPMLGFGQAISTRYPTLIFQHLSDSKDWLKIPVRLVNYWLLFLESGVLGTKKSNIVTSKNCKNAPDTKYCGTCQIWEVTLSHLIHWLCHSLPLARVSHMSLLSFVTSCGCLIHAAYNGKLGWVGKLQQTS